METFYILSVSRVYYTVNYLLCNYFSGAVGFRGSIDLGFPARLQCHCRPALRFGRPWHLRLSGAAARQAAAIASLFF